MKNELLNINKYNEFKAMEAKIIRATSKVEAKLDHFKQYYENVKGNWSKKDKEYTKDWNKWHDLYDRLKDRYWDNWRNFKEWHFETFGFNTYSFQ